MKKFFILLCCFSALAVTLLGGGCATTDTEQGADVSSKSIEERIESAEAEKASLIKKLDKSESVDDTLKIKRTLSEVQKELDALNSGEMVSAVTEESDDDKDGFKNTKDRTILYGPLGVVLKITEWVLVKLYILN